jgi:ribosomal protein S18 acetylase RimI-like enzyme
MQRCLEAAAERGHRSVWLGVWEHNPRAIAFYERWGFVDVGEKSFVLGTDRQTDRVMVRVAARADAGGAP